LVYTNTFDGSASGSIYIPEADGTIPIVISFPTSGAPTLHLLITTITPDGHLSWSPIVDWNGAVLSVQTTIQVYVCNETN